MIADLIVTFWQPVVVGILIIIWMVFGAFLLFCISTAFIYREKMREREGY